MLAALLTNIAEPAPTGSSRGAFRDDFYPERMRIQREDEEILALIKLFMVEVLGGSGAR